jgi:hypothetical protein
MSTLSQETVFRLAVSAAEATRQNSIAVAFGIRLQPSGLRHIYRGGR